MLLRKTTPGVFSIATAFLLTVMPAGGSAFGDVINVPSATYPTIQSAIIAAVDGDTVLVANGTYTGAGNTNLTFGGRAITVCSQNGPDDCTIDGGGAARGFSFGSTDSDAAVVDGFTIRNGSASPYGGGIRCDGASPTIANCTIVDNYASSAGGGIYCSNSNPLITGCTISGNHANYNHGGGGIALYSSSPEITNCTISANTTAAPGWGGGILLYGAASPVIVNCLISGNQGISGGGGIALYGITGGTPTITNCLIVENTLNSSYATYGGGIYCAGGAQSLTITNCTISGNSADNGGGMVLGSPGSVANCILWGNAPSEIYPSNPTATITYSDVAGGWTGEENINLDPDFVDADNGDYRLLDTSPCIDEGDDTAVPPDVETDLDGYARVVGDHVDMGAYEFADSDIDSDEDGLLDGTEIDMAADGDCPDPFNPDSDGDTLLDGEEVDMGTDPCLADTDADGIPDNLDPYPTDPEGNCGYIEDALRDLAAYINALDPDVFLGANVNAKMGRRNSLANRANAAANFVAAEDYTKAIGFLNDLLSYMDGEAQPPDWIADAEEEAYLKEVINALLVLLGYM